MAQSQMEFCYFTGTGNSLRVTQWLAEAARESGYESRMVEIGPSRGVQQLGSTERWLGVISPTHGFTAPWTVIRFAFQLPRGGGRQAFVIFTRAGMKIGRWFVPGLEGTAAYLIVLLLVLKGYRPRGAMGLDMPSNWTVIHPSQPPEVVEAIIERAKPRAAAFFQTITSGATAFCGRFSLLLGLLLLPLSVLYLVMGRFLLAKLFYASDGCTGCGLCAQTCPVSAIKMAGKPPRPYWTFLCVSCTRCRNFCPQNAVEASYPLAALLQYLTTIPIAVFLLDQVGRWIFDSVAIPNAFVAWVISYPFKLLAVFLAYGLFWLTLRWRWFNHLVTRLTPTHYYRRYREPETQLADWRKRHI